MGINSDSSSSFGSRVGNFGASFITGTVALGFGVAAGCGAYSLGSKALKEDVFTRIDKTANKSTKLKGFLKAFAETVKKNPKTALLSAGTAFAAFLFQKMSFNETKKVWDK
jgi:hypothetical protein